MLMIKRLTVSASTLRARDADEKARLAQAVETRVWPWLEAGRVRPVIDRTFPLERATEAHQWLEGGVAVRQGAADHRLIPLAQGHAPVHRPYLAVDPLHRRRTAGS